MTNSLSPLDIFSEKLSNIPETKRLTCISRLQYLDYTLTHNCDISQGRMNSLLSQTVKRIYTAIYGKDYTVSELKSLSNNIKEKYLNDSSFISEVVNSFVGLDDSDRSNYVRKIYGYDEADKDEVIVKNKTTTDSILRMKNGREK